VFDETLEGWGGGTGGYQYQGKLLGVEKKTRETCTECGNGWKETNLGGGR